MSNLLAERIANWLIQNGAKSDKREVYVYGIECTISSLFVIATTLLFALLIGKTGITVIWFLFFLPLRHTSGGLHASSHIGCFLISITIGIACILLNSVFKNHIAIIVVGNFIIIIIIFLCAPVLHINHPVSKKRLRKIKRTVRIIITIQSGLVVFFLLTKWYAIAAAAVLGILAASMSTAVGYLFNKKAMKHPV